MKNTIKIIMLLFILMLSFSLTYYINSQIKYNIDINQQTPTQNKNNVKKFNIKKLIKNKIKEAISEDEDNSNLTIYNGCVEVLTFNTLMAFPEKALDKNNSNSIAYDESKLTTNEFLKILEELYKNNYILVDIFDIIDNETLTLKTIKLPPNKKPIILTFDNVTYKSNYQNLGEIDKIIIDRNNNLASYTTKKSIQDRISYDNEFILIIENFIKKHPDFSFKNAKGIIFFTGENGILGYNTSHKNTGNKFESKKVSAVIKKLKNLNWKFGSNNYCYSSENSLNDLEFAKQLNLWNQEIKSIIGDTILYAYPYGIHDEKSISKQEILLSSGFKIFFENSMQNELKKYGNMIKINRKEINGKTLRNNVSELSKIFDCSNVYDFQNRFVDFNISS